MSGVIMKCPICGNDENNQEYIVKELQTGLRDEFEYIECSKCKCLFLKEVPNDISKYYDKNYAPHKNNNSFKSRLINKFVGLYFSNNFLISKIAPKNKIPPIALLLNNLVSDNVIDKNSSIIDVGCGDGLFLNYFKNGGFKDLTGIDLFLDDNNRNFDVNLIKTSLENFKPSKKYDLVISNHAFEHMDNQLTNLKCFENLVNDDGLILLRIPVKSQYIWDTYGVNWYQIDAPRHLFLHTIESFKILCSKTNLIVEDVIFDSSYMMFVNSEKYANNISMRDESWSSYQISDEKLEFYNKESIKLNNEKNADQAIFILKLGSC